MELWLIVESIIYDDSGNELKKFCTMDTIDFTLFMLLEWRAWSWMDVSVLQPPDAWENSEPITYFRTSGIRGSYHRLLWLSTGFLNQMSCRQQRWCKIDCRLCKLNFRWLWSCAGCRWASSQERGAVERGSFSDVRHRKLRSRLTQEDSRASGYEFCRKWTCTLFLH